ncbi:MAG: MMPL family transporter [Anaerolineae bacterium]|nr:MMPL family transporter [Anaerolineae bacterium]
MFDRIGRFAAKYRYPVIAFWVAVLVVVTLAAPDIGDVAVSEQSDFLPLGQPSLVAAEVAAEYFPDQASPSQAVLVIKSEGGSLRDEAAQAYLAELVAWLQNEAAPGVTGEVLSPTDPALASRLLSQDNQVAMIVVGMRGTSHDEGVQHALEVIQARLDRAPAGLTGYVTGSAAIAQDYLNNALASAESTTLITVVLVIAVLLIIYRSPVSPIIPLATIGMAYGISRKVVAGLSLYGWKVSSFTDVFLVVLLFGAGTDYCLFLVSRFREYMADNHSGPDAARHTVSRVGETITSSAGTVIVGMAAMYFAELRLFSNTGPSMAIGIFIALLAGLTLTPALLAVLGRWAFWPGHPRHAKEGGFWERLATWVTNRPWLPLALGVVVLVPLVVYGRGQRRTFDLLADLPPSVPSKAGFLLLSGSMGAGEVQPLEVIITEIPNTRSPQGIARIYALTHELLQVPGVADVRSLTAPVGRGDPALGDALRVDKQLLLIADQMDDLRAQTGVASALAQLDVDEVLAGLNTLRAYLDEVAASPDLLVGSGPEYQSVRKGLDRLEEDVKAMQQRLLVGNQLAEAAIGIADARAQLSQADLSAVGKLSEMAREMAALRTYLTGLAQAHPAVAKMDGYPDALAALDRIDATTKGITDSLLVSTQLEKVAAGLGSQAAALADPAAVVKLTASPDQAKAAAALGDYLRELVSAYPALALKPAFRSAADHLLKAQTATAQLQQGLLVSGQLGAIAQRLDAMSKALDENPLSFMPKPGEPSAGEQMEALGAYLDELGAAYPALKETKDYQTALAVSKEMGAALKTIDVSKAADLIAQAKKGLPVLRDAFAGLAATAATTLPQATFLPKSLPGNAQDLMPALAAVATEIKAAADDLATLAKAVREEMPQATFAPKTVRPGAETAPNPLPALGAGLADLSAALERLATAAAKALPDATYIPADGLGSEEAESALAALLAGVDDLQTGLRALAAGMAAKNAFLIPTALVAGNQDFTRLLDTYTTPPGDAARLQVILADEPYSPAAMETVARLRDQVTHASRGYVSGASAILLDLRAMMDRDFVRVMALVLAGIVVVLVLLLRSIVAPAYMVATILLSYGATLGLTRLVFDAILHKGLAWWVPFFMFVLLVALGMDYNIFLMGRVKEEVAGNGTRAGVAHALQRTGGIITSAGIIMAGTFAAMMSASLLGLVQLAFAITVGVLLDTFVVRTTLVPAIAVLLDRWNWWPGRGPGK